MEIKEFPVLEEYKKCPKITPEDVAKIRQWLKLQPHLPEKHITDLDIVLAYHSCNNCIEVSKQLIDLNYSLRTVYTSYFKDRKFDAGIEEIFRRQLFVILPTKSKDGNSVLYTQAMNPDPNLFDCTQNIKALFMSIDLWQFEYGTSSGLEMVINFSGYTMAHVPKLDLKNLQQFSYYVQEAIPLKLKKIHLLNAPSFIDRIMNIFKPFLKTEMELLQMVKVHSGLESIDDFIPLESLPKDVGGDYKTLKELEDEVITKMRANNSFFVYENKKRVVESLRPGKPTYKTFGLEGSFKKLEID